MPSLLGLQPKLVARFAVVGGLSTLLYAGLAISFERWVFGAVGASVAAYCISGVFSYLGQKFVTFASAGSHAAEAPRFLVVTAAGFALATAIPATLTGLFGLPAWVSVLTVCIVIPVVNLVVLDRWVFAGRKS